MTNLQKELKGLENLWEMACEEWESLKGTNKKLFEANEMNPLRVKIYELKQRIDKGETGDNKQELKLKRLEDQWEHATKVYETLKGKKRIAWENEELNPLRVQIYNLKKELGK
jgi:hypothetical protein